ncbi:T9SS type A sorting domain-containing protein [Flavobacterium sp. SM15]|uniref:RCC1 domain-containing protein n=1 Tax=Flavobacterium sp. SM15 TaxID=2908005 RepID=UPI001EDB48D4|nr:T9SS type A sorting domain-containing protein [Flavobacterium sp. SM15]MCG2611881.1 T9SS type A sorting domain-containing protein [Flavobacterium sp. SM15]
MKKNYLIKNQVLLIIFLLISCFSFSQCWESVSQRGIHSAGIKTDGSLWTWGNNIHGQLGDGTLVKKSIPIQIGTDTNWRQVSCGEQHTIALKTDGTLWVWGDNGDHQLGIGPNQADVLTPTQLGTDTNWDKICELSPFRSYAIKTDGTLWAWGSGYLGNNLNYGTDTPIQIGTATNWKTVSSGWNFTIGLKTDGTLWSWGDAYRGALGNGSFISFDSSLIPRQIGTDSNWKSISTGDYHTIATKTDGSLYAWGYNTFFQLGNNSNSDRNVPTRIGTATDWDVVYACAFHSMAKKNDGTVWAWGNNSQGQLGVDTYSYYNYTEEVPMQINASTDWSYLGAGYNHTLGLKNDGSLYAWGHPNNGSLGNGNFNASGTSRPILINNCSALNTNDFDIENQFSVYPNPTNGFISIVSKGSQLQKIEFYDLQGRLVITEIINNNNFSKINISHLGSATYLMKITTEKAITNYKIIKN